MKISVFTPAYNRGYIIENLYHSLQRQTFRDFEWIVINDGSTDNTDELFSIWCQDKNDFPIIYKKVENGGKHRAINQGVQMASGELFFIVDSDDYLTNDALERIINVEKTIPAEKKQSFGGVCGLRGYSTDKEMGTTFAGNTLDITMLERDLNGISGDKAEAFYTNILKQYPFPEFNGEKFITECVVWNRIAHDGYKLRFFNEIIYLCEYLPDGLTVQGSKLLEKNPKGWGLYLAQQYEYKRISCSVMWDVFMSYLLGKNKVFNDIASALKVAKSKLIFMFFFRCLQNIIKRVLR